MTSTRAVDGILEFIGRVRPGYARTLRCEIAGMTEGEQEERVTQALAATRPRESESLASPGMSLDDRAFFDELRAAKEELETTMEILKAQLEK